MKEHWPSHNTTGTSVQLGSGVGGKFQERCPCVTHPGSSISTQPNESFMDLNYKGTKSNTFFFLKQKSFPSPSFTYYFWNLWLKHFLGVLRIDFYQVFIKCANKVTSSESPLKRCRYWQKYVRLMCRVAVWRDLQRKKWTPDGTKWGGGDAR